MSNLMNVKPEIVAHKKTKNQIKIESQNFYTTHTIQNLHT